MSLTKLSWPGIISDIPAGDGKIGNLSLSAHRKYRKILCGLHMKYSYKAIFLLEKPTRSVRESVWMEGEMNEWLTRRRSSDKLPSHKKWFFRLGFKNSLLVHL
jgi:hypothetical protein